MKVVEILYFDGCPGHAAAVDMVKSVVRDASLSVEVREIRVLDDATATAQRFLGSPTIRVDGRDVAPDAEGRSDFAMQCRVYSIDGKLRNTPARAWIERALGVDVDAVVATSGGE